MLEKNIIPKRKLIIIGAEEFIGAGYTGTNIKQDILITDVTNGEVNTLILIRNAGQANLWI